MPTIADARPLVTGGVDTHAEVHVAGVVDQAGRVLGAQEFPATAKGYQAALAWMRGRGELGRVGVEGTGGYGAGLARHLAAEGVGVTGCLPAPARRRRGPPGPPSWPPRGRPPPSTPPRPGSGRRRAWAPRSRAPCWPQPAPTPVGCAPTRASPPCAAPAPSMPPPASRSATA